MQDETPTRDHWNQLCVKKGINEPGLWRCHSDAVNAALLKRWLPQTCSGRVLKTDLYDEALCDGLYPHLISIGSTVVGIDVSPSVQELAQRKYPRFLTMVGDVRELPVADDSFDVIVSNSTLDHFSSQAEIVTAIKELARVLRPGGHLVLTLDNPANPIVWIRNRLPNSWVRSMEVVPYYVGATLSRDPLAEHLREAGLEILDQTAVLHCPRIIAVAAASRLNSRGQYLQQWFLRVLNSFEHLERWASRYRTGYFIAAHAAKPASQPDGKESASAG